jgi:pimeloyl-ACP methyl ester carboxylesterase
MPKLSLLAFLFLINQIVWAQIYHFETGKVLSGKPGQIIWNSGIYEGYPADYGSFITLENPGNSHSKELVLPLIRIKAMQSDSLKEPVFLLHGGPGEKNLQSVLFFPQLLKNHDVILMGYRGVEGSRVLDDTYYKDALFSDSLNLTNYQEVFTRAFNQSMAHYQKAGIDYSSYSMEQVANDLEQIRQIENYHKISLLSFSYGTMIAQTYATKYKHRVQTNVQIGVRAPDDFHINNQIFKEQLVKFCTYRDSLNNFSEGTSKLYLYGMLQQILSTQSDELFHPIRFSLFFYSQFYTLEQAMHLLDAAELYRKGKSKKLWKTYTSFYTYYPNMLLGDLLLKKQKGYNFDYLHEPADAIDSLILVVNNWYTPLNTLFSQSEKSLVQNPQVESITIHGALDVATPINDPEETEKCSRCYIIPECGHLDFFYSKKKEVNKLIDSFFN